MPLQGLLCSPIIIQLWFACIFRHRSNANILTRSHAIGKRYNIQHTIGYLTNRNRIPNARIPSRCTPRSISKHHHITTLLYRPFNSSSSMASQHIVHDAKTCPPLRRFHNVCPDNIYQFVWCAVVLVWFVSVSRCLAERYNLFDSFFILYVLGSALSFCIIVCTDCESNGSN